MSKRVCLSRHCGERQRTSLERIRRGEMQYTLMFYLSPSEFSARTDPARREAFWGAFLPYMQAVRDAGIFRGGAGLETPDTATTVRVQSGKRLVQDGPYADTKEQLGGFFV